MNNKSYVLEVDPVAASKPTREGVKVWNMQRQLKFECMKKLEEQHNGKPLHNGPVHLDINFYLPVGNQVRGTYYTGKPTLSQLLVFIDNALRGTVIESACVVSSCLSKKMNSVDPRIEFKISTLSNL